MSEILPEFFTRLEDVACTALLDLKEQYPDVFFYFVEPDYYSFFSQVAKKHNIEAHVENIITNYPIVKRKPNELPKDKLDPSDTILYIGRPFSLLQICQAKNLPQRVNPLVFVSIPVFSYSLRIEVWKMPINFKSFSSLCFPFVPFKHYLQIAIGNFTKIFLSEPVYETKALKAALSSLMFIFGGFHRAYGIGPYSASITKGFLDCETDDISAGSNILVLMDRTVDLMSIIRVHDSYQAYLEEIGSWDANEDRMIPEAVSKMLKIDMKTATNSDIFSSKDNLFENICLMTLPEAQRRVNMTDVKNSTAENLILRHTQVMQFIHTSIIDGYLLELVLKIQRRLVDATKYGRVVPLAPEGPSLAFRMLSILHNNGMNEEAKSIARLLAAKFGITKFSKWNQIDEHVMKAARIEPPAQIKSINPVISSFVSIFGQIVTDEWKRPNFPIADSYVSSLTPVSKDKHRWFVGVIGGMSTTELKMFKRVAKLCRPSDDFVFMTTGILSPRQFMNEVIS